MGWWLQLIGGTLAITGSGLALAGFAISPQNTVITTIRNLFSQTQSIKVLPPSLGGNLTLNLDNLGTLRLHVPYSLAQVTLLLDVVPTTVPIQHDAGVQAEGAEIYNQKTGTAYTFDTNSSKRHEIAIGGRVFVVSLLRVIKLEIPDVPGAVEYQFGISER